ncbi:MAG: DUF1802 family protein [Chroococcidiopsidaceae cyanobacterium CP_BM_ER_R8_30]|nr:DUF1802 family protein [Chroococcidiopsidaceae cyanobacterium CP_BM_ER_R8_30]
MMLTTTSALKEWAVAVDALEQGKTILLLRKGGIHEQGGQFKVGHNQVLLYPTYEHQQPSLLKPDYAHLVTPVPSGWHPETVRISAYAQITAIFQVSDESVVLALLPFHIWTEQFVRDRLKWKPQQPLYILLLRTYKLNSASVIPYRQEYGGCKSWIDIAESITVKGTPVLDDAAYTRQVHEIAQIVKENSDIDSNQPF